MLPLKLLLISSRECGWEDLRVAIRGIAGAAIVGDVARTADAIRIATSASPAAIICSDHVDGHSALPLLRQLRGICPQAIFIVATSQIDAAFLVDSRALKIAGYIVWCETTSDVLGDALRVLLSGEMTVSSWSVTEAVSKRSAKSSAPSTLPLSPKQGVILRRMVQGLTDQEIAHTEGVSRRTVQRVIEELSALFDVSGRAAIGAYAGLLGLISAEDLARSRQINDA